VEDLVGNALRLAHQKRFEDAILRLYRACELLAQLRLRHEHGLNTGDLDLQNPRLSQLPEDLAQLLRERKERENRAWAGLLESYRILAALGDPLGKVFAEKWGERLKDLLRMRNSLFLTHGLNPVAEAEWERARDLVQGFFSDAFAALNRGFSPVKFPEAKEIFSS
jgi:CRISPR-associated protein (TIGR02710 family)